MKDMRLQQNCKKKQQWSESCMYGWNLAVIPQTGKSEGSFHGNTGVECSPLHGEVSKVEVLRW